VQPRLSLVGVVCFNKNMTFISLQLLTKLMFISSILVGAIQDLDVGVVVGKGRTFGKGLVQNVQDLPYQTGKSSSSCSLSLSYCFIV